MCLDASRFEWAVTPAYLGPNCFASSTINHFVVVLFLCFFQDSVTQETRIKELQLLCAQLKEEKSSEYERVQAILQVSIGFTFLFSRLGTFPLSSLVLI